MSVTGKKTFSFSKEMEALTKLSISELRRYLGHPEDEAFVVSPFTKEYRGVIVTIKKRGVTIIIDTFLGTAFAQLGDKLIIHKMYDILISNINKLYTEGYNNLSVDSYVTLSGGRQ